MAYRGKIKPEHADTILTGLARVTAANPGARATYAEAGHSAKRFRWDVFWAANRAYPEFGETITAVYQYANDTHLDTLLRYALDGKD